MKPVALTLLILVGGAAQAQSDPAPLPRGYLKWLEAQSLVPIKRTQTQPPYPALSRSLKEEGTTVLKIVLGIDGKVKEASIEKSSGFARLDQAALEHVKANWHWQPQTGMGRGEIPDPVASVTINWNLKNAN